MKTLLFLLLSTANVFSQEAYVILKQETKIHLLGFRARLVPGDCFPLLASGGAYTHFKVADWNGSVPWHGAQIVKPSDEIRARHQASLASFHEGLKAALEQRKQQEGRLAEQRKAAQDFVDSAMRIQEAKRQQQQMDALLFYLRQIAGQR